MEVKTKAIYKHFKGDLYFVEDIAIHSESGEKYVVYRALMEMLNCISGHMICLLLKLIIINIQRLNKNIDLSYKI